MTQTVELTDFNAAEAALREKDLKQSLYDAGSLLMDRVLVTLHGDAHKTRRLTEMRVFRRDFFKRYEQQVLPRVYAEVMADIDRTHAIDLVQLNYRFMVYLATAFAGIDRPSDRAEALDEMIGLLRAFGVAATLGQAKQTDALDAAKAQVLDAIATFKTDYFEPSVARRLALIEEVAQGRQSAETLPMDVLTVLLQDEPKLQLGPDMMMRESAFFFLASAHTSVHSLGHAMDHLLHWCEEHPDARAQLQQDPVLVQRFVHESFRLHPSSPIAKRTALAAIEFNDGQQARTGDTVVINLREANRDPAVFGADAATFNPFRTIQRMNSETGITFGIGMHACLGKNLAAGALPKPGKAVDEDAHQLGTVAWICAQLLGDGIQRDPDRRAELDQSIERETWQSYPVRFP